MPLLHFNRSKVVSIWAGAFALVIASCAGSAPELAGESHSRFELEVFGFPDELASAEQDFLVDCALFNGLQAPPEADNHGDHADDHSSEYPQNSAVISVAIQMLEVQDGVFPTVPDQRSEAEIAVLTTGPVTVPGTSETFDGGCERWAGEQVSNDPRFVAWSERSEDYGLWVTERIETSPDMLRVDLVFGDCMADQGYGNVANPNAAKELFNEIANDLMTGAISQAAALEQDEALFSQFNDCQALVAAQRAKSEIDSQRSTQKHMGSTTEFRTPARSEVSLGLLIRTLSH